MARPLLLLRRIATADSGSGMRRFINGVGGIGENLSLYRHFGSAASRIGRKPRPPRASGVQCRLPDRSAVRLLVALDIRIGPVGILEFVGIGDVGRAFHQGDDHAANRQREGGQQDHEAQR